MGQYIMRFDTVSERDEFYNKSLGDVMSYVDDSDEVDLRIAPRDEIWYTSTDGTVIVPNNIGVGYFGANIISNTYENGKGIIKFDGEVTKLGGSVFKNKTKLANIIIPESVTLLDSECLWGCSNLLYIYIPRNVHTFGYACFYNTRIQKIFLNENVTTIGNYAFQWCSLKTVYIGKNVGSIGSLILDAASNVVKIIVDNENTVYDSRGNCNAIIKTSTNQIIEGCKKTVIPSTVTSLAGACFRYSGITTVKLPSNIIDMGNNPFQYNNINSISVDKDNPVYDSRNNCNAIIKTDTNTLISGCKNTVIPDTVVKLANNSFYCMYLTKIHIPASVTSMHYSCFQYNNQLTTITVDSNNPVYDSRNNCNGIIETATNKLVIGCKGTVIPYGVVTIGLGAFYLHNTMTSITIPETVTSIQSAAFASQTALNSFTCLNPVPPTLASDAITGIKSTCVFYVPSASVDTYKAAPYWSARAAYIQAIP